jgi:hypothetical protein
MVCVHVSLAVDVVFPGFAVVSKASVDLFMHLSLSMCRVWVNVYLGMEIPAHRISKFSVLGDSKKTDFQSTQNNSQSHQGCVGKLTDHRITSTQSF